MTKQYQGTKARCILVGLTSDPIDAQTLDRLTPAGEGAVQFEATTYSDLLASLKDIATGLPELLEIVDDYEAFLANRGVLSTADQTLVAMLSGTSHAINTQFQMFFEAATRKAKWHRAHLFGLYRNKCVSHIGRLQVSIICQPGEHPDAGDVEYGTWEDSEAKRLNEAYDAACKIYPNIADEPHRFYLMDTNAWEETHFAKTSKGGLFGHRYFDLAEWAPERFSKGREVRLTDIAADLRQTSFE